MIVDYITLIFSVMLTYHYLGNSILAKSFVNSSKTDIKSIVHLGKDEYDFVPNKGNRLPNQISVIHGDKVKDEEKLSKFNSGFFLEKYT